MHISRQIERQVNRKVAERMVKALVGDLPRRNKREVVRAYANAAYRWNHPGVCHRNRHGYKINPNPSIVGFIADKVDEILYPIERHEDGKTEPQTESKEQGSTGEGVRLGVEASEESK